MVRRQEAVLHFVCTSCETHLAVDHSMAGVKAPCPKCGELVVAPEAQRETNIQSSSSPLSETSLQPTFPKESPVEQVRGPARRQRRSQGGIPPTHGRLATENEKTNFKALIKILIATALVVLLVVLVSWYLKNF